MTLSDLVNTLLLVGFRFYTEHGDNEENPIINIDINGQYISYTKHPDFQQSIWRYLDVVPFDIGAAILEDERVLVLYEGAEPNRSRWENHCIFDRPEGAWDFIRNFLQEHPA